MSKPLGVPTLPVADVRRICILMYDEYPTYRQISARIGCAAGGRRGDGDCGFTARILVGIVTSQSDFETNGNNGATIAAAQGASRGHSPRLALPDAGANHGRGVPSFPPVAARRQPGDCTPDGVLSDWNRQTQYGGSDDR
jgi:hypothetical protein